MPELLTQAEVNALPAETDVMVLAPRLDPQPRRCVIRKRRAGRSRHGHYATDAHTLFNSEGESLGVEFFYAILAEVGNEYCDPGGPWFVSVCAAGNSDPGDRPPSMRASFQSLWATLSGWMLATFHRRARYQRSGTPGGAIVACLPIECV